MKISDQCCSLKQSKELRKLGVIQDSLLYHPNTENKRAAKTTYKSIYAISLFRSNLSAFTVAELSVMLGDYYPSWCFNFPGKGKRWIATVITKDKYKDGRTITTERSFDRYAKTQAQALAALLIAVINVGHIQVSTINKRLK